MIGVETYAKLIHSFFLSSIFLEVHYAALKGIFKKNHVDSCILLRIIIIGFFRGLVAFLFIV